MVAALILAPLMPQPAALALATVTALVFAALLAVRLHAVVYAVRNERTGDVGLDRPALSGDPLPVYTVLIALRDEARIAADLVRAMSALDYPAHRLEILFLLEADDTGTMNALATANPPAHMRIVVVPPGRPHTKPRALCHGLAMSRGDYIVVYDAEDRPEPDQLQRALAAFEFGGSQLGCVQARLNIYNAGDSVISAQFAVEYTALFDTLIPALAASGAPVPLGGTSNHFPRHVLIASGGWDPWNVTEDADLGFRLARLGWQTAVLNSTTWEEAPRTAAVWFRQRTRWQKGWMQTYMVHMRSPFRLWSDLGPRRFLWFQLVLGGGLLASLAHPWFAMALIATALAGEPLLPSGNHPAAWLWCIGLVNLAAAAIATIILAHLSLRRRGLTRLLGHALVAPLMWLPISLAAYRALWELHRRPFHWAKTPHGHSVSPDRDERAPVSPVTVTIELRQSKLESGGCRPMTGSVDRR